MSFSGFHAPRYGSADLTVKLWDGDAQTGTQLYSFNFDAPRVMNPYLQLGDFQGRIDRAVWGPLNNTIISASEDVVIRIWDSEVVIGGGQDASHVTTTDRHAGWSLLEAKFFHRILQEEIGGVKGHFGPINELAFNPGGRSFSSGGEDGYVRLHHFDSDHFNIKM